MGKVSDLGEFGLIARLARMLPGSPAVLQGIGDDCAVVRCNNRTLLLTCDMFVEEVHFRRAWALAEAIGWKAAAAALSDIAAMGGRPDFALVSLGCPEDTDADYVGELYRGMADVLYRFGAAVVGGDTVRLPGRIALDVFVVGESPGGRYLTRRGARAGDLVVVTGRLGVAAAGLHACVHDAEAAELRRAHFHPRPRIAEGQWLCGSPAVHAMIDVSDGLVQDVGHVAEASGVGVNIRPELFVVDPGLEAYCAAQRLDLWAFVLAGGEDYQLAFAVDAQERAQLFEMFHREFRTDLTVVGEFTDAWEGVRVDGQPPAVLGFDQFRAAAEGRERP